MRRVRTAAPIALVVAVAFVLPLTIAQHYHALGVPRGDDWSYLRTLYHWVDTGHLNFNNWVSMTLVGQLVLAAPIALVRGHDTSSVQALTAALGVMGLLSITTIVPANARRRWVGTFIALVVASGPFFGTLTVSFMTDVPAFGCSMLSLALGVAALRRSPTSTPLLTASMAAGLFAFTIREYALIPTIAVALTAAFALYSERDYARLRTVGALAVGTVVFALAFYGYWHTIPDPKPFPLGFPTGHAVSTLGYKGAGMFRTVGFWLLPVIALVGPSTLVRRAWATHRAATVGVVAVVGAWLSFTGLSEPRNAFAGNYFVSEGILARGVSSGVRPRLVPMRLFELFVTAGTIGAVLLALVTVPLIAGLARHARARRLPSVEPDALPMIAVGLSVVGYTAGYAVAALAGLPLYDRYVLPIVPLVALLVASERAPIDTAEHSERVAQPRRVAQWRTGTAVVGLVTLFAIGVGYTVDSASFDGSRWRVSEAAVHAGWAPRQVGGNFEWVNFYAEHPGTAARSRHFCVIVVVGQRALRNSRRHLVARGTYSPPLHTSVPVVAQRTRLACAPPRPPASK